MRRFVQKLRSRETETSDTIDNDPPRGSLAAVAATSSSGSQAIAKRPGPPATLGVKTLHSPESAVVDIVFVHGLTGHRDKTWTACDASEPWPKSLLPSKLPTARTLTFGYDAYVADWRGVVSQERIANHGWKLLTSLATYRGGDNTTERPIIFVCHSLGGLVCEDALVTSGQRSEAHLQSVLGMTVGIAFLGTPHHGSGLARWAERLSRTIGVVKQTNTNIIEVLKRDSEVLARIQDSFHTMVMARSREGRAIEITCFHEELPIQGVGVVVPKDSAILPGYIPIGIHGNHMDMTKFATLDDPGFEAVCGELIRWVNGIGSTPTIGTSGPGKTQAPEKEGGNTMPLLLWAAMAPSTEELERILSMTSDVNVTETGTTKRNALHMAVVFNQPRNILPLLRAGVDKHAVTNQGFTPLFAGCICGNVEVVKVLLEEGGEDPNSRSRGGSTLLHAAATNGYLDVTRELLNHGADPFLIDDEGWTPLNAALAKKHMEVASILEDAMRCRRVLGAADDEQLD